MFDYERRLYAFTLGYARQLVADIDDARMTAQPTGLTLNHAAWVLGHLAIAADFGMAHLGAPTVLGDDWKVRFGPGSKIRNDRGAYPSKAELWSAFESGVNRLIGVAANAEPERLGHPHSVPFQFMKGNVDTVGELIAHLMTTHQATHLGQLSAWRRALGLPEVLTL